MQREGDPCLYRTENGETDMKSEKGKSGNKGEWSELYTLCYLLNAGILKTADRHLNPNQSAFLPIIRILRKEDGDRKDYRPEENKCVRIFINDKEVKTVPKKEFEDTVTLLYENMRNKTTDDPLFLDKIARFMGNIHCTKIKANSTEKKDITIQIHDTNTNQTPIQGFSIKSYMGKNPTLLNAGNTTNFTFRIKGCDDALMKKVNAIGTSSKIVDRIEAVLGAGCSFEYTGMESDSFRRNLQKVDSLMPQIIAEMLLIHYTTGEKKLYAVAEMLEKKDPFGMDNGGYYIYKMKTVLCAFALGMIPSVPWNGYEDANGGYIVVKEDGDVVCFFLYDRNVFEDYLLDCTIFERASTGKHDYAEIYEKEGKYFMKLNLQIRFTKPSLYKKKTGLDRYTE